MKHTFLFKVICIFHFSLITPFCTFAKGHLSAQELTLEACKQMARDNYPAIRQYGLIEQSRDLTLSNAAKAWLPGVSVTGFGVVMTDVLRQSSAQALNASPLGEMKNSIYGASLMVNQVVYDGGAIGAQKQVAKAKSQVEEAQIDVQLYNINERVEQLFFGILMIDEQIKQVVLLQDNLAISEKTVKSMMNGGLANQSDLDQVNVNQVQAEQQLVNLKTIRKAYIQMLGYFIGQTTTPSNSPQGGELLIVKPNLTMVSKNSSPWGRSGGVVRPEMTLFTSQENMLTAQRKALDTRLMPTVSAFGMASYHNKMLPIMKDKNLMAGVMLKWNIGALYTRKNDIASLENQRQQIDVQRQTFLFNNSLQQQQTNGQIESLREQMALDEKAVALRESILEKARKKVEMGTETVNELLRDVNAVSAARQEKAIHEIQLLQEINKLNTIMGVR